MLEIIDVLLMLSGALITLVTSRHYYERAGKELQRTADELKETSNRVLRWLELEGKDVTVVYDKHGNVLGLARSTALTEEVQLSVTPISGVLESGVR